MSIEDINYLYKNSIKESSVILIDSSKRDKNIYQSPNSYSIILNEPFKYVYGIEILDSTIPRTMYLIDVNNDTLVFYTTSNVEESIILDHRDYTLDDLINSINIKLLDSSNSGALKGIQIFSVSSPSSDVSKIFFSNSSELDEFYILAFKSNMAETIGFDENSINSSSDYTQFTSSDAEYDNIATNNNISSYGTDNIINKTFKSGIGKGDHGKYAISDSFSNKQNIQSPGLINLIGDRYIKLRSSTIEQHLHNSISNSKNAIGLGLFKLGFSGYVDNRFDFINVKYRDFHPIGKLSSIDFRFETLDDKLYDFKGINHHFILNIKFYTPIQEQAKIDYVLNPNYNPNLIEYKKLQYDKYDSDEDIEEITNDFKNNFLKAEKKYEYSSDEDLEYLTDNSDDTETSSNLSSSSSNESINKNNMDFTDNRTIFHPTNYESI